MRSDNLQLISWSTPIQTGTQALHGATTAAAAAKSRQSCPTLCDPIDSSPPGSAAPGILQACEMSVIVW